ncbi:uncharacterized protein FYW47_000366 [Aplochiton taeniatus]
MLLAEVRGLLLQLEGEKEALVLSKREQEAEVGRLTAEVCSLHSAARDRAGTESVQAERRCVELEGQLALSRGQLAEAQEQAQGAKKRAEEQSQQLQVDLSTLRGQHDCVSQQLVDRRAELQRAQRSLAELHVRERSWEGERSALQGQLSRTRKELHSATLRGEAELQREEQIAELQGEVVRLTALLENERQEMQRKLDERKEEMKRLREEQQQHKDKAQQGEERAARRLDQAQQADQELREENRLQNRELQEWKERCRAAAESLRLSEEELEEARGSRDTALGSLRQLEGEVHSLGKQNQELQARVRGLGKRWNARDGSSAR